MSDAEEISALMDDMRSGDENRLISASVMLAQFGKEAVEGLLSTLKSPLALVRDYSAMSLGLIGTEAIAGLPALCTATKDQDHKVRYAAIVAVGKVGGNSPIAVSCLNAALGDLDETNRKAVERIFREISA